MQALQKIVASKGGVDDDDGPVASVGRHERSNTMTNRARTRQAQASLAEDAGSDHEEMYCMVDEDNQDYEVPAGGDAGQISETSFQFGHAPRPASPASSRMPLPSAPPAPIDDAPPKSGLGSSGNGDVYGNSVFNVAKR